MEYIGTCLWFNDQAEEAAHSYCSIFPGSGIDRMLTYGPSAASASGRPAGSVMTVEFRIENTPFLALNGGPHFRIDPSISFFISCESEAEMEEKWNKLKNTVRMELAAYPFAKRYGWCEDRFGVNWQLVLGSGCQKISPALLFSNKNFGKGGEAIAFYVSRFPDSRVNTIRKDEKSTTILHSRITLANKEFVIFEGPMDPVHDFSPAVSFVLGCDSQEEIDAVWKRLSDTPEDGQCGWLQDPYGVSWQVVPKAWGRWLFEADPEKRERLMQEVLRMKKIDMTRLSETIQGH